MVQLNASFRGSISSWEVAGGIIVQMNGWQRLWVVASVLSLVAIAAIVFSDLRSADEIEDVAYHTQRLAKEVTVTEIAGLGSVNFPDDLTKEEIANHVKRGMSTSPPTVVAIAQGLLDLRAQRASALARARNRLAHSQNQTAWAFGVGGWLAFIVGLYLSGWALGWVRRGFRAT